MSWRRSLGRLDELDAAVLALSDAEELDDELDDAEDELRRAARAGILLLEKNQELSLENAALRAQVAALESEKPGFERALQRHESELAALREERRTSLLEITRLQAELRSTSQLVTSSLDREQRLKQEKEGAEAALAVAEERAGRLQQELELARVHVAATYEPAVGDGPSGGMGKKSEVVVTNPAATYDSNQSSSFSLADYEELLAKWQRASEENETLHLEMKSLRKDLDAAKRKASKLAEASAVAERLEKKTLKLQHAHDALAEQLTEERALCESQRTMIAVYKKIADARPFSTECTCALHGDGDGLGVSLQDQLMETNTRLERELRELQRRVAREDEDSRTADDSTDNNSVSQVNNNGEDDDRADLLVSEAETTLVGLETVAANAEVDFLIKKIQSLEENQSALKDSLRHAKQQWQAAIASQKALEECNNAAQAEITRLTQQVEHKVSGLGPRRGSVRTENAEPNEDEEDGTRTPRRMRSAPDGGYEDDDDSEKWVEETAPFPAPPGDLNSPLIKCLLDHWTTDKSKIMHLTDWLHHAIRGTGKPRPLRLEHLTSEVAAGFTQLLVPILRERHGVSVTIYRRESIQILTDMVFQAHQPTQAETPSIFSTLAAKLSGVMAPSPPSETLLAEEVRARVERSNSSGSAASSESGSVDNARARRRRQEHAFLMSEAHFLYG